MVDTSLFQTPADVPSELRCYGTDWVQPEANVYEELICQLVTHTKTNTHTHTHTHTTYAHLSWTFWQASQISLFVPGFNCMIHGNPRRAGCENGNLLATEPRPRNVTASGAAGEHNSSHAEIPPHNPIYKKRRFSVLTICIFVPGFFSTPFLCWQWVTTFCQAPRSFFFSFWFGEDMVVTGLSG